MPELHWHAQSVQKVASKHQRVPGSHNGMDPARREEYSFTRLHDTSTTTTHNNAITINNSVMTSLLKHRVQQKDVTQQEKCINVSSLYNSLLVATVTVAATTTTTTNNNNICIALLGRDFRGTGGT